MLTFVQWFIRNLGDGKFTLAVGALGGRKFLVKEEGTNVIARDGSPPTRWVIKGPDGGPYTLVPLGLFRLLLTSKIKCTRIEAPRLGPMPILPVVWTVDQPYEDKFPVWNIYRRRFY